MTSERPLNMAQSDSFNHSSSNDDRSEQVTGVPAFWPKPTIKPRFLWRDWIDMFHMAADLKDGGYTRTLLNYNEVARYVIKIKLLLSLST